MNTKVRNILRCYAMGMGIKEICTVFELSRNTVRRYVRLFQNSGKTPEQLLSLSPAHLQEMFGGPESRRREPSQRELELEALLPDYAVRLSRKGVTKKMIYEEYKREHPDGYRHSSFGVRLQQYMVQTRAVGHVEHYAGDQMYIDFAGDKLEIVDNESGEVRKVEVFVAILPCSYYTYCEAVFSQGTRDLIRACENALRYFEGAPLAIVPDNLKAAVIRSDHHEPRINDEFAAFAEHYGCAVYPARVRRPKDKALVENAVKLLYRTVYLPIEGMIFHEIGDLNTCMHMCLHDFNEALMAGRGCSRKDMFLKVEKEYLQPLPEQGYMMKERKVGTVMKNSYVKLLGHNYSVPVEYIGKRVDIIYDEDLLEIYCGFQLITTHHRDDTPYEFTRKEAHNLPGHYGSYDKDLDDVYQRAAEIDNIVLNYLKEVARVMKYPAKAFRSCRGILSLEKKYSQARLVAACACATEKHVYSYTDVKEILEKGDDVDFMPSDDGEILPPEEPKQPRMHGNIRGRDYYAAEDSNKTTTIKNKENEQQ